jgi:hypothetical protein
MINKNTKSSYQFITEIFRKNYDLLYKLDFSIFHVEVPKYKLEFDLVKYIKEYKLEFDLFTEEIIKYKLEFDLVTEETIKYKLQFDLFIET